MIRLTVKGDEKDALTMMDTYGLNRAGARVSAAGGVTRCFIPNALEKGVREWENDSVWGLKGPRKEMGSMLEADYSGLVKRNWIFTPELIYHDIDEDEARRRTQALGEMLANDGRVDDCFIDVIDCLEEEEEDA